MRRVQECLYRRRQARLAFRRFDLCGSIDPGNGVAATESCAAASNDHLVDAARLDDLLNLLDLNTVG